MASSSKLFPGPGTLHDAPFPGINEFMFRAATNPFSEVQFVPERVVEFCTSPDGIRFYKVQWEKTWISEHYLLPYQNLIDLFWQSQSTPSNCESNNQLQLPNNFSVMTALQTPKSSNVTSSYDQNSDTTPSLAKKTATKRKVYSGDMDSNNETINETVKRRRITPSQRTVPPQRRENIIPNVIANLALANKQASKQCIVDFATYPETKNPGETSADNSRIIDDGNRVVTVTVTEVSPSQNKKRSIQLEGVELLNVENSSVTDVEMKQYAQELLSSYSKRRPRSPTGKGANVPHTCFFCQKVVSDRKTLREHHLRIHLRSACPFACDICQKRFMMRGMLKEHMLAHSDNRNYSCKVCGLTFKRRGQLNSHMKKHKNQNHFQCCLCDKNFKAETELKEHSLNGEYHQDESNKCTRCQEILTSFNSILEHSLMHARQIYVCQICNASFKTKSHLTLHENKRHTESKRNYKCSHCEKEFYKVEDFRKHLEQEHQENSESFKFDYVCTVCGKDFAKEGSLINHMKKHDDESLHVCTACGREFAYENALKKHTKRHEDGTLREKKSSVGRMSDESVSKFGGQIVKIIDDTGEAALQCKLCPQVFKHVPTVERHLQKHKSGSLPREGSSGQSSAYQGVLKPNSYQCKCKRSFKYKSYLLAHLQKCTLANKGASKRKATPNKSKVKLQWQAKNVSPDDEICVVQPADESKTKRDVPPKRRATLKAKEKLRVQAEDLLLDDELCSVILKTKTEVVKASTSVKNKTEVVEKTLSLVKTKTASTSVKLEKQCFPYYMGTAEND